LLGLLVGSNIIENVTHNEAGATPLYIGNLACTDLEPQWLEAQSVPSASLVPCLQSLPAGWSLSNVTVNNGRSVLTLDNDRAGMGAMVVRLAATCDPAGASPVLSDQPGVRRLMLIQDLAPMFSATRFDVFPGGCVSTRMTAPVASRAEVTSEASLILGYTTRQSLQQTLEERSGGRLHLNSREAR
jgi:hypothetical protein